MKAEDILVIKDRIQSLLNQQLQRIFRFEGFLCLQFGRLIESETRSPRRLHRNENGEISAKKVLIGEYVLHLSEAYRISHQDEIILAQCDRYNPSTGVEKRAEAEGRTPDWEKDDFDAVGHNKLDETIGLRFRDLADVTVDAIDVSRFGDLVIKFANGFILETFSNSAQDDECWRFWHEGDANHLVVTGVGIEPPGKKTATNRF
jgi:hypothetical protein